MGRRTSRESAMKLLYQIEIRRINDSDDLNEMLSELSLSSGDYKYVDYVVKGVIENRTIIDEIIDKHLKGWKISRLSKVDLSILRLAIYEIEMLKAEDIPKNVSINEAVELAKKYSTDESASFINGVLSKLPDYESEPFRGEDQIEKSNNGN